MNTTNFMCPFDWCKRTYSNKKNLKRHIEALHREVKRFRCDFCQKVLSSRQNLREHRFTHTGEQPYFCKHPGCNLSFRQGSQLSTHKRIHRAIDNYAVESGFLELKVKHRQLTSLLSQDSRILHKQTFEEETEACVQGLELPPILFNKQYGPLYS